MAGYIQHYLLVRYVILKQDLYELYDKFGDKLIIGLEGIYEKDKMVRAEKKGQKKT